MNRDELLQLAERVERAEGPDRELDCRIWLFVGERLGGDSEQAFRRSEPIKPGIVVAGRWMGSALEKYPEDVRGVARNWNVPTFTASLDAAMSLVPEGWTGLELLAPVDDAVLWSAYFHGPFGCWDGFGATRELAIVSASLKALASQIGGEG
jgi:hypothetical protein